ncbi:MAG: hypothetical protein IKP36_11570 [Bacteroidaceae bacterium]|nr:hypothetical protein [Bacteroidaceae bacterium]
MVNEKMAEIELDSFEELQEVTALDEDNALDEQDEAQEVQEAPEAPETPEAEQPVSDKEKLMRSLVSDDDETDELTIDGIRQVLDAAPRWFLSQWKLLLLCLAGIFLYITNGYQAQMELMEETELESELKDWRYRSITRVSELTLLCRQSQLEQKLREQGDSTLLPSKVAPFIIKETP